MALSTKLLPKNREVKDTKFLKNRKYHLNQAKTGRFIIQINNTVYFEVLEPHNYGTNFGGFVPFSSQYAEPFFKLIKD